jgi:hypothetical protein
VSTDRRSRARRATRAAQQVEDGAKRAAIHSRRLADDATADIEAEQERTQDLVTRVGPALRGHLLGTGIRHRHLLEARRDELERAATADSERWSVARQRVRSLEKLVERLDGAQDLRRRRADNAAWQDMIASRATRARPTGTVRS